MDELTASDLSQGSPSEAVRAAAEDGVSSYVTRNSKVYGVLSGLPVASPGGCPGYTYWVDERERAMTSFEADHPDATAEQFAAFVAAYPEFRFPRRRPTPSITLARRLANSTWHPPGPDRTSSTKR